MHNEIISEVSRLTGVPTDDMRSLSRNRRTVYARTLAIHAIRTRCLGWSLQDIGSLFETHHSNVAHSLTRHRNLMQTDPNYNRIATLLAAFVPAC